MKVQGHPPSLTTFIKTKNFFFPALLMIVLGCYLPNVRGRGSETAHLRLDTLISSKLPYLFLIHTSFFYLLVYPLSVALALLHCLVFELFIFSGLGEKVSLMSISLASYFSFLVNCIL